jgi:hypothetical protein
LEADSVPDSPESSFEKIEYFGVQEFAYLSQKVEDLVDDVYSLLKCVDRQETVRIQCIRWQNG